MRVAVVYPIEFGTRGYFGGGERYAYELARALAERVDCRLVVAGEKRTTRFDGRLRVDTHRSRPVGGRFNPLAPGIVSSILEADVVHCVCYGTLLSDLAIFVSRGLGKKVFITDVGGRGRWSLVRYGSVFRLASGLLNLSEFSSLAFPGGRPGHRTIYGGVDTERFRPGTASREQVLFVGRLLPHKGVDFLIDAMPPDGRLTIIGQPYDPPYLRRLRKLAEGKQVRFRFDATDQDVAEEMRSSAVAVLPSVYTDFEGASHSLPELLGLTVLEAMACETPVVCTKVGSLPEIVEDGVTGLLVPPNDPGALRRAIERLVADPGSARKMGEAARRRVLKRFTWDRVAETCLSAYEELS